MAKANDRRLYIEPDVIELERVEELLMVEVRRGGYFEPESFEDDKISEPCSPRVQKLLARKAELVERVRPQCVPIEGEIEEAQKAVEEEFGLGADDWGQIDTDPGGG